MDTFIPQWMPPESAKPFEVSLSNDFAEYPTAAVRVKTIALSAQYHRDMDPEWVVDDLTHQIKRRLIEMCGLEAETRDVLHRKLMRGASSLPDQDRVAVMAFLAETFGDLNRPQT